MIVPVIFSIFFTFLAHGQTKNIPPPNPPAIGNFANQRQPSTHFGFGQNIVPEQTFISYLSLAQNNIAHKNLLAFLFEWVYGITNYLSLYTLLPVIIKTISDHPNGGVGDLLMQLEYAPYQRTTSTYTAQVTVIGNITIPTARLSSLPTNSIKPPIGFNAPTFFLGFTASYLSPQWYAYASSGAIITTPSICNTKFGNNILYQTGIGYNLGNPGGITLAGILELSGTFVQHTKINHVKNPNSGSNIILFGPCIYATHNRWEFWGGIQAPIVQNLNGIQNKLRYTTLFTISLTF